MVVYSYELSHLVEDAGMFYGNLLIRTVAVVLWTHV